MVFIRFNWVLVAIALLGAVMGWFVSAFVSSTPLWLFKCETITKKRSLPYSLTREGAEFPREKPLGEIADADPFKSPRFWSDAVRKLDLVRNWKVDDASAVQILKNAVTSRSLAIDKSISIKVALPDPVTAWHVAKGLVGSYRSFRPDGWDQEIDRCQIDLIKAIEDLDYEIRSQQVFLADLKSNNERAWWLAHHPVNLTEANGIHERPEQAAVRDQFLKECEDAERKLANNEDLLVTLNKRAEIMMPMDCIPGSGPRIFKESKVVELPGSPNGANGLIFGAGAGFLLSPLLTLILLQNCGWRAKEGGTSAHPG